MSISRPQDTTVNEVSGSAQSRLTADAQMRILVGADVPPNADSGASGTVFQMNLALRALGHHVDEIWSEQLGRKIQHGNLHYLLELPRAYRRELRRALKRTEYDVVEFNQPHSWLAAADFRRRSRRGVFVNRSHGHEIRFDQAMDAHAGPNNGRGLLRTTASKLMRRFLYRHWHQVARLADGFVVSSHQDADFLKSFHGVGSERIAIVSQGLSDEFLQTPMRPLTPSRLQRLLYVGNFSACKAPEVVAESVSTILTEYPQASMTWVCEQAGHPRVMQLLKPSIRHQVTLLDWMPQRQLVSVMDECGLFLFPSLFEGYGKAPLEAMSRGLCVIASNVGGMQEFIADRVSGYLVEPGQSHPICDIVRTLFADDVKATDVSRQARQTAETRTWKRCGSEAEAFYRHLIDLQPSQKR